MGRSQVEYNRKHGRGRGRGGRGRGRGDSNNSAVPRHSHSTASSKARTSNDSDTATSSSPVPSYMTPTSSSAGKSKPQSPKNGQRKQRASSSPKTTRTIRGASATPPQSPNTTTRTDHTTTISSTAVNSTSWPAPVQPPELPSIAHDTPRTTPMHARRSSKKDPPVSDQLPDPLPDSPDQRTSSPTKSNYNDTLLLYAPHSHVTYPKPHETPILQNLTLDPDALAKALELSLPWYQRLRIDAHVALEIDPERCRDPVRKPTKDNDQDMDTAVDALLGHTDTFVELESINEDTVTDPKTGKKKDGKNNQHQEGGMEHMVTGSVHSSSQSAAGDSTASSGGESKLMQRARRFKQQHPGKLRSYGTSQEGVASRKKALPDPPAHHHGTAPATTNPASSSAGQAQHEWDIAPAMSDLTLPTALHSAEHPVKPRPTTGMNVITRVVPIDDEEEDDMDQWLDSALRSQDKDDEEDEQAEPEPPTVPDSNVPNNDSGSPKKQDYTTTGINLEAFAEDDEDNMEDWLDTQIS